MQTHCVGITCDTQPTSSLPLALVFLVVRGGLGTPFRLPFPSLHRL